jgi:DNA-binding CsgD family transcriptional regulator
MDKSERAAVEIVKHRRLLRTGRDGRVLSGLMLPLLRWSPSAGYGVITTTGRKTGRPRSKCVRVVRCGDRAYLVALVPPHTAITQAAPQPRSGPASGRVATLSAREIEVLTHVANGKTNADIGRVLHISEATVKTHLLRVFAKLGVSDRTAAVTTAMGLGILPT